LDFFSLSDSESVDELDDGELDDDVAELESVDDLSDGECADVEIIDFSLIGDAAATCLLFTSTVDTADFSRAFVSGGGETEDVGDFRVDLFNVRSDCN
jgi:hypothetical protein